MPIGDRSLSLLDDPDDRKILQRFLNMVPRFLRTEIDELFVRIHPIPTIEMALIAICDELSTRESKEEAVEEAKSLFSACFRQLGGPTGSANSSDGSSATGEEQKREDGQGIRRLEQLLELRDILESDKYGRVGWYGQMLLSMSPADCDRLIVRFSNMRKDEARALALVSRDLDPPGMTELLWMMENPDDGRNPLIDAKRRDHQHAMLMYESVNQTAPLKFDGYDPSKTSDFMPPPPKKIEMLGVNSMGEDKRFRLNDGLQSEVEFVDTLSEAISVRPFAPVKLDTTRMFDPSTRAEVYQFVVGHSNRVSGATGDKQGEERKAALEEEAQLMRAKGRWWAREANQRKIRLVKEQLHRIAVAAALRVRRALERRMKLAEEREERLRQALAAQERQSLNDYAASSKERMSRITQSIDERDGREKALFASLKFFDINDCSDEEIKGMRMAGSYRTDEWTKGEGVPRTAYAASVTFGTAPHKDHSDETYEMNQWKADATMIDKRTNFQRKLKKRVDRSAELESFTKQIANWKNSAKELDQGIENRKDKENKTHIEFLEARNAEKVAGAAQRVKMRVEALRRGEHDSVLEQEAAERLKAEQLLEEKERERFGVEEARQRAVDDFWGIPTAWAYYRRLEEYKRKVWQARIADRRKRMVQVGNSTGEDPTETAAIRGAYKEPWQRDWLDGTC